MFKKLFQSMVSMALIVSHSGTALAFGRFVNFRSIHSDITRGAMPFLKDDILDSIVSGNLDEDSGQAKNIPKKHSQNCQFKASAQYINDRYQDIVKNLVKPDPEDLERAPRLFGSLLHGVQDFYSHSNWVPTFPQGLGIRGRIFENGLGFWPVGRRGFLLGGGYRVLFDDVVLIQGNPEDGVSVRLGSDADGRVISAVPIVTLKGGKKFRGVMTSGVGTDARAINCPPVGEDCTIATPENICLQHSESRDEFTFPNGFPPNFQGEGNLNLDGSGGGDWAEARSQARLQTQHEWCRLLHLTRKIDRGYIASGRVLGNWIETDNSETSPHIFGTPCQRGAARSHLVEITATPGQGAPDKLPFVVFRSDFTSSARTTSGLGQSKKLSICGNPGEMIVASLVPARDDGVSFVVTVPAKSMESTTNDHRGAFETRYDVKISANAC